MNHLRTKGGASACRATIFGNTDFPRRVTCKACQRTAAYRVAMSKPNGHIAGPGQDVTLCKVKGVDLEATQIGQSRRLRLYLDGGKEIVIQVSREAAQQIKDTWR